MLIDGTGAPPVAGRAVVVEQGRIAAVVGEREAPVGHHAAARRPHAAAGLINCHVHLCFGGEADPAAAMLKEAYPLP